MKNFIISVVFNIITISQIRIYHALLQIYRLVAVGHGNVAVQGLLDLETCARGKDNA